jgi:hypothetical protein
VTLALGCLSASCTREPSMPKAIAGDIAVPMINLKILKWASAVRTE